MSIKNKLEKVVFKLIGGGTCREFEGLAYDFLEGKLDPKTTRKIEKHMKLCPPCVEFMDSYRCTQEMGRRDEVPSLPIEFKEHLKKMYCN